MQNDFGPQPFVTNIEEATLNNQNFRTTVWTGAHLQLTTMSIPIGSDIGLEIHDGTDQFLRIEQGTAKVQMGQQKDNLDFEQTASAESAIFVPTNTWHNITNIGDKPLKIYSIYAPAHHPHGTIHTTRADAEAAEANE